MKTHLLLTTLLAACTFLPAQINSIPAGDQAFPGIVYRSFTPADTANGNTLDVDIDQDQVMDLRFGYSFVNTQTWGRAAITVEGMAGTQVLAQQNPQLLSPGTYAVAFPFQAPVPGNETGYMQADAQLSESSNGSSYTAGPFPLDTNGFYLGVLLARQGVLYPAWVQVAASDNAFCAWTPCPRLRLLDAGYSTTPLVSRPDPIPGAGLTVYPNPAQSQVHIESATPVTAFEISDVQGRVLLRGAGGYAWDADVSALPAGLYLCTVHTDAGTRTHRLRVDAAH